MRVYEAPLYYEIAFGFIDARKQVDLFERFVDRYSGRDVKRFLDIGCGPSLQLREIAKRGYGALGLDASPHMLSYLKERAKEEGTEIETIQADMRNFRLKNRVDFAFIMMGTIGYLESNEEFMRHLDSVASSLKKGGLYLIENFRLDWGKRKLFSPQKWTMRRNGIIVKTTYRISLKDALEQLLSEELILEVHDHGKRVVFKEKAETKMIFPQEFLALVKMNGKFEFLGWFKRGSTRRLAKARMDNIVLLRRK